jgi:mono/diheme cytochrome c family protein
MGRHQPSFHPRRPAQLIHKFDRDAFRELMALNCDALCAIKERLQMRKFAVIFPLMVLAAAGFFFARRHALLKRQSNFTAAHPAKTNAAPQPTNGFYVGKGDERVFINYATPDPVLRSFLQSVMDGSSDPNAQGREIFMRICAACHQRDGDGKDGVAPPLLGSEWALTPSGARMTHIVLNGVNGPLRVRGRDWNLAMPPWRENLNDDQISVVLTFIRTQLGTNHASAITPEFVAAARKEPDTKMETADKLLRISDQ